MKHEKIEIEEVLFLAVYAIWFTLGNLRITYWTRLIPLRVWFPYTKWLVWALLALSLYIGRKTQPWKIIGMILLMILGYVCRHNAGVPLITQILALAICARNVDYRKILRVYIYITLSIMVITVTASRLGLVHSRVDGGRDALGYMYVSFPTILLMCCSLAYFALREYVKWYELIIIVGINLLVYYFTRTRVVFGVMIIFLLIYIAYRAIRRRENSRFIQGIMVMSPFLIAIISFVAQWAYNPNSKYWEKANLLFSSRLSLGHDAINNFSFTLLGQKINWITYTKVTADTPYNYVDNFYLQYGLTMGLIFILAVLLLYSVAIYKFVSKRDYVMGLAIIGVLIFGMIDPEVLDLRFHPFVLFLGYIFSEKEEGLYEQEIQI